MNVHAFSSNFCQRLCIIKLVTAVFRDSIKPRAKSRTLAVCKSCVTLAGVTASHNAIKNAVLSVTGKFISEAFNEEIETFSVLIRFKE